MNAKNTRALLTFQFILRPSCFKQGQVTHQVFKKDVASSYFYTVGSVYLFVLAVFT